MTEQTNMLRRSRHGLLVTAILVGVGVAGVHAVDAQSPEAFYAGKKIEFIIGSAAGGGYGIYASLLARYLGKHIPGNPQVVPTMMPGAGSLTAANQLYTRSPHDGTTIGAVFTGAVVEPLIGDREKARYDARRFGYIGSANRESSICFARPDAGIKSWSDLFEKQLIIGAAGWTSSIRQFPAVLAQVLGMKFKIVTGYPGSSESVLAVDKGEVQGICGIQWSSFAPTHGNWIKDGKVVAFGQIAAPPGDPELNTMGVQNLWDVVKNPEDKQVLETIFNQMEFGRPYLTPPGVPADRLEALRTAFDATMKDPDFLAEAAREHLPIDPMTGQEVQAAVAKLYSAPDRVVERARQALEEGGRPLYERHVSSKGSHVRHRHRSRRRAHRSDPRARTIDRQHLPQCEGAATLGRCGNRYFRALRSHNCDRRDGQFGRATCKAGERRDPYRAICRRQRPGNDLGGH
jgi:tripartite-type tricarboxylate transporter receptor subunit TctC